MNQKDIKKRANVGIRRKAIKGFKKIKKLPGEFEQQWPELIFPITEETDERRRVNASYR